MNLDSMHHFTLGYTVIWLVVNRSEPDTRKIEIVQVCGQRIRINPLGGEGLERSCIADSYACNIQLPDDPCCGVQKAGGGVRHVG